MPARTRKTPIRDLRSFNGHSRAYATPALFQAPERAGVGKG
jgi:hypothetical protein